ncbi:recombinase family protein [Methylobacterium variabile]|jgi:Recombinase|uniref:recombinase family protein n=1 Tax=Methylobacterium variabile TaxID=298794 RepID=UPI0012ED0EE6|nr:recombinase family protein [Methylobacterium variabile]
MKTGIDRFAGKGRETSIRVRQERAKRRAAELTPVIAALQAGGAATLQAIADALNERGIPTPRGCRWTPTQVSRLRAQADQW